MVAGQTGSVASQCVEAEIRVIEREMRESREEGVKRVFPLGVGRRKLERALHELRIPAVVVRDLSEADTVFALSGHRDTKDLLREPGLGQVVGVRSDTYTQVLEAVRRSFAGSDVAQEDFAVQEAEQAAQRVLRDREAAELMPQNPYVRRLQHEVIAKHKLHSESTGRDPRRRVRILPERVGT